LIIHGATRGNYDIEPRNDQINGSNCENIGCHQWCSKWGLHQGEAIKLLHREGNQDQTNVIVVALSGGVHGNIAP